MKVWGLWATLAFAILAFLLGQAMASTFAPTGPGQGSAPVADPASNQPPLLAQPHA